ncbi:MAG: hypothetical protein IIC56_07320 [Proteobacteria bacterium]|nr:hypothetical protein [Pseudomonadota bacterium]
MANASTKALPYLAYSRVKHRRQHEQHREEQQSSLEPYQRPPDGDWRWWLFMAGRWSGKTYAGATWLNERAEQEAGCRVAVIAPTLNDAAETIRIMARRFDLKNQDLINQDFFTGIQPFRCRKANISARRRRSIPNSRKGAPEDADCQLRPGVFGGK